MNRFYTYLHCKPNGDPFYVGKGCGNRAYQFNKCRNTHHRNTIKKYGVDFVGVFVFPCESESQAFADEVQQIAQLRAEGYELCNQTDGGEGSVGATRSAESRLKMSLAKKGRPGRPHTDEFKQKTSLAHKGKTLSAETRAKISAARTGKKLTEDHKRKISAGGTGLKRTEKTKANISAALKGLVRTDESRARMSLAKTGKPSPNKGIPMSDAQKLKISASRKLMFIARAKLAQP